MSSTHVGRNLSASDEIEAMKEIVAKLSDLSETCKMLQKKIDELFSFKRVILNSDSVENSKDTISTVRASVSVEKLSVIKGKLNEIPVRALLDDGCNTTVTPKDFLGKHRSSFDVVQGSLKISHSDEHHSEKSEEIVCNARLVIE